MASETLPKSYYIQYFYSFTSLSICSTIYLFMINFFFSNPLKDFSLNDKILSKSTVFVYASISLELIEYIINVARESQQDPCPSAVLLILKGTVVALISNSFGYAPRPSYLAAFLVTDNFITFIKHLNNIQKLKNRQTPFVEYLHKTICTYCFSISTITQLLMLVESLPSLKQNQYIRWFPSPLPNKLNFVLDLYLAFYLLAFASFIASIVIYYRRATRLG